jgi:hypothetical protein
MFVNKPKANEIDSRMGMIDLRLNGYDTLLASQANLSSGDGKVIYRF